MAEGTRHLQIKRGVVSGIPTLAAGELGWATDTKVLYVGDGATNNAVLMASQALGGVWLEEDVNGDLMPGTAQLSSLNRDTDVDALILGVF